MTRHDDEERDARRILERVARESEPGGSVVTRLTKGAHDHIVAADVDQSDAIEYWGTRVGRGLGLVLALTLMVWLAAFLLNHG